MIRFAAFFNRYGETGIKPQHLAKPSTRSLLSGTHWGFPPADRWMRSMLKETSENTRWGFRWEPWDWLPSFPFCLGFFSVPECSLLLSVSEQGRGVGEGQ